MKRQPTSYTTPSIAPCPRSSLASADFHADCFGFFGIFLTAVTLLHAPVDFDGKKSRPTANAADPTRCFQEHFLPHVAAPSTADAVTAMAIACEPDVIIAETQTARV